MHRPSRRAFTKNTLSFAVLAPLIVATKYARAERPYMIIDDFSRTEFISALNTTWRGVSDKVMGGVTEVSIARDVIDDQPFLRLTGDVSLENNGGFLQAALPLAPSKETFDASGFRGVRLLVRGNGEQYSVHLRTPDNRRSWQSYRSHFTAGPTWTTIDLPFLDFAPYRLKKSLDTSRLRRIGLVAIGRAFHADLAIGGVGLYS
jgi:hypothetical protein